MVEVKLQKAKILFYLIVKEIKTKFTAKDVKRCYRHFQKNKKLIKSCRMTLLLINFFICVFLPIKGICRGFSHVVHVRLYVKIQSR